MNETTVLRFAAAGMGVWLTSFFIEAVTPAPKPPATVRWVSSDQLARARDTAGGATAAMTISQYRQGPMPSRADEDEVRALYTRVMDGWNIGSGEAFAAPFADDCDFVAFDGVRFRGREEMARFHESLFKTHLKGTRLVGEVTDVRFLANDIAVIHASGGTVRRGKSKPAPERNSIQTLVAVKRNVEWQIVAFQNTRVRPIGRNLPGTLIWLISDWLWSWGLPNDGPGVPRRHDQ